MILYDKSGLFLGMGNQELYFLGYEDMDEFKNYHNDLAELFVNKPGYIFKFKNFSWIDYTLHSGTPNKKVIVKTKSGREVETALVIHEIFLNHTINNSTTCYCIELSNGILKADLPHASKSSAPFTESVREPTFEQAPKFAEIPQHSFLAEDDIPVQQPTISFTEDYNTTVDTPSEFEAPNTILFETTTIHEDIKETTFQPLPIKGESPSEVKLKIDHDILIPEDEIKQKSPTPAPLEYQSIDDITISDLNFTALQESYLEDANEDLLNDSNLFVEGIKHAPVLPPKEAEAFDLSDSAEQLGLDLSTIAEIIGEYSDELTNKMNFIRNNLNENQLFEANQEIVKLKSIALALNIPLLYNAFAAFQEASKTESQEDVTKAFNALQSTIIEFKEIIQ